MEATNRQLAERVFELEKQNAQLQQTVAWLISQAENKQYVRPKPKEWTDEEIRTQLIPLFTFNEYGDDYYLYLDGMITEERIMDFLHACKFPFRWINYGDYASNVHFTDDYVSIDRKGFEKTFKKEK